MRIERIVQVLQNCMIEKQINTINICACMYRYILNIHAMQTHPLLNPPPPKKREKKEGKLVKNICNFNSIIK